MDLKLICIRTKNIIINTFVNYLYIMILTLLFIIGLTVLTLMVSRNKTTKNKGYDRQYYVAAVVEYNPNLGSNILESIQNNLPIYEDIIHHASQYDVDILVFPEAGLTGVKLPDNRKEIRTFLIEIPSPETKTIPCFTQYSSSVLNKLSCAARLHHMYVVVNLLEIEYCSTKDNTLCPEDSAYYYNTNVVFDREGRIIARYRKYNLFRELGFNHTNSSELCTFDTDFGVRFGMFICFDILFQDPSVRLIQETGVKDVIFSAAWFSEMPLLTANAVQAGWAYTNDVNLIAAGYNSPAMCAGGSGIYAGRDGPLVTFMPDRPNTQIILSKVLKRQYHGCESQSKKCAVDSSQLTFGSDYQVLPYSIEISPPNRNRSSDLMFKADKSFRDFHTAAMRSAADTGAEPGDTLTASYAYERDGFGCTVTVSWRAGNVTATTTTGYNMFAYAGHRKFGGSVVARVETCGLTSYASPPATSDRPPLVRNAPPGLPVTVTHVRIEARTPDDGPAPVPITLDARSHPLAAGHYAFSKRAVTVGGRRVLLVRMELSKPAADLVTFGVYKLPARVAAARSA